MRTKILKTLGIIILVLAVAGVFFYHQFTPATQFTWGLNFSQSRARELGFDARVVYMDMLSDLHPSKIRLAAYWNEIEPVEDQYNFAEMDDMLKSAELYKTQVILVVGKKEPRWPECHEPDWAKQLSKTDEQAAQLAMIKTAVDHFKIFPAITIWQVENEPLFGFGEDCPKLDRNFLKSEIALVKSLDTRPVLVADSGEVGQWLPTATAGADLFGTTMYRVVHNNYVGYIKYPLPPAFFRIKAGIVNTFAHPQEIIGVELDAEPWLVASVADTDLKTQLALMNPNVFAQNVAYAKQAGFSDNYLWGVEWWYWLAKKQGDWGMWAAAKSLLAQ